jgi:S-adenosylmethionine/arginine decarboxylase-like enzyme
MTDYWGYHLIFDASGCDHDAITSYENVHNFAKQLVNDIDMVAYGEPQIVDFGSGNKAGFTLVQLIETSNICAHFVNEHDHMYLDVFSCKPFEPNVVVGLVEKYFNCKKYNIAFLERQAPSE